MTNKDTDLEEPLTKDVGMNTDDDEVSKLRERVAKLEEKLTKLREEKDCGITNFRLETIADDDSKVAFYTGFSSSALIIWVLLLLSCITEILQGLCRKAKRDGHVPYLP